jgi:hypothetical protein
MPGFGLHPKVSIVVADVRHHRLKGLLGRAQSMRLLLLELLSDLQHGRVQLPLRNRHGHQADSGCGLAVERAAGQEVEQRLAGQHQLLQGLGGEAAGKAAVVDFRQAELRILRRNGNVGGTGDVHTPAQAPAADRGDGRMREEAQLFVSPRG